MANRGMLIPCSGRGSGYSRTLRLIPTLPAAATATAAATSVTAASAALTEEHDSVAFTKRGGSRRNHAHAFGCTRRDFNLLGIRHAKRDGLELGHVAFARHIHALLAPGVDHRIGRHDQDVRLVLDHEADFRVHPGL